MSNRGSFYLRESMDLVFDIKRVSLYLIVPPVLAFIVYFESYLSGVGATRIMSLRQNVLLALWNSTILLSMIAGLQGGAFFSRLFGSSWFRNSLALPVRRMDGFLMPVAVYLALVSLFFVLTVFAILVAMPQPSGFAWPMAVINCYTPVLWSVAASALFGLLLRPASASFAFLAATVMGAVMGLEQAAAKLPGWISWPLGVLFPRLGESFLASMAVESRGYISVWVPLHALALLLLGVMAFRRLSAGSR